MKKHGYNHKYDPKTDETCSDFKKKQDQRKRTDEADKKDADELLKKAENDERRHKKVGRKRMPRRHVLLLLKPEVPLLLEKW